MFWVHIFCADDSQSNNQCFLVFYFRKQETGNRLKHVIFFLRGHLKSFSLPRQYKRLWGVEGKAELITC